MPKVNIAGYPNEVRDTRKMSVQETREQAQALPFAVEVDLIDGNDYTKRYKTLKEADGLVQSIFKSGYDIQMREDGGLIYHPAHNIKRIILRFKDVLG